MSRLLLSFRPDTVNPSAVSRQPSAVSALLGAYPLWSAIRISPPSSAVRQVNSPVAQSQPMMTASGPVNWRESKKAGTPAAIVARLAP